MSFQSGKVEYPIGKQGLLSELVYPSQEPTNSLYYVPISTNSIVLMLGSSIVLIGFVLHIYVTGGPWNPLWYYRDLANWFLWNVFQNQCGKFVFVTMKVCHTSGLKMIPYHSPIAFDVFRVQDWLSDKTNVFPYVVPTVVHQLSMTYTTKAKLRDDMEGSESSPNQKKTWFSSSNWFNVAGQIRASGIF